MLIELFIIKEKEKKQCKNTVKSNQFYTQDKTDKHKLMY